MENQSNTLFRISIGKTASVGDALRTLAVHKPAKTGLPAGIVLVCDKENRLCGITTNGDINRALAQGVSMETPVTRIMNKNPFTIVGPKTNGEIISTIVDKIRKENLHKNRLDKIIIVDSEGRVVNVANFFDIWQTSDVNYKQIGVIGLGFVGLTLGVTLADLGFHVKGYDIDEKLKADIKKNNPPFYEEGLVQALKDHNEDRFAIVEDFKNENNCDVYFVSVGTPLDAHQNPKLTYIKKAARDLGKILKKGDLIILRSTVPLGTTRNVFIPAIEEVAKLKAGEDFYVAFAPERTVEGKALQELRVLPQVVGGINKTSSHMTMQVFQTMTNSVHIVDSLEEAEMVKLINNSYRDVTFGFANEVALICKKWGIDSNKMIEAANVGYERGGVPKPSPGVGGYCLTKDPHIFMLGAREKGYEPVVIKHAREANEEILYTITDDILDFLDKRSEKIKRPKILVLGLAFKGKPATSDLRGSTAIDLVCALQDEGYDNIYGYDPVVKNTELRNHNVKPVTDLKLGFEKADAVIIMNNHKEFEELDIQSHIKLAAKDPLLMDTWALYTHEDIGRVKGVDYRRL